jgi:hypothetical protein
MEAFFREVTKVHAMPLQQPELWRAHSMELVGAPLALYSCAFYLTMIIIAFARSGDAASKPWKPIGDVATSRWAYAV